MASIAALDAGGKVGGKPDNAEASGVLVQVDQRIPYSSVTWIVVEELLHIGVGLL